MTGPKTLSASEIRGFVRKHAKLLGILLDSSAPDRALNYDETVSVTARILVDHGGIFCDLVCVGTGMTDAEVQSTPWPIVVNLGCEVIEANREHWRSAWPNGFLQAIVRDELRPFSASLRGAAQG